MERRSLASALLLAGVAVAQADVPYFLPLPGLEATYGGVGGTTYVETTFSFGTAFRSITFAHLDIHGVTDPLAVPPIDIAFTGTLDGVDAGEWIYVDAGHEFQMLVPLIPPLGAGGMLDGVGTVGLHVNLIPTSDLVVQIQQAELQIEAIPVPEPTTVCLLAMALLLARPR